MTSRIPSVFVCLDGSKRAQPQARTDGRNKITKDSYFLFFLLVAFFFLFFAFLFVVFFLVAFFFAFFLFGKVIGEKDNIPLDLNLSSVAGNAFSLVIFPFFNSE